MNLPLALLLGLVFGAMVWWRCFYSVLQYREVRREGGDVGRALLRVLFTPGPWAVLGVAGLGWHVLTQSHDAAVLGWGPVFFGAFAAGVLPALLLVGLGVRRERAAARREKRRGRLSERGGVEGE